MSVGQSVPLAEPYSYHWGVFVCGYPLARPASGPSECPTISSGVSSSGVTPVLRLRPVPIRVDGVNSQSPLQSRRVDAQSVIEITGHFTQSFRGRTRGDCLNRREHLQISRLNRCPAKDCLVQIGLGYRADCSPRLSYFQANIKFMVCQAAGGLPDAALLRSAQGWEAAEISRPAIPIIIFDIKLTRIYFIQRPSLAGITSCLILN